MTKLIISCMDRRLTEMLKEADTNDTVIISNAGANVNGLSNTITKLKAENDFKEVLIVTHSRCGAMATVSDHLFRRKRVTSDVYVHLVRQFEGVKTEEELDEANRRLQESNIKKRLGNVSVTSKFVDLNTLRIPEEKMGHQNYFRLIVSRPVKGRYKEIFKSTNAEMYRSYALIGYGDELTNDVEIASSYLGINEVTFVIHSEAERKETLKFVERAKMRIRRSEIATHSTIRSNVVENFQKSSSA